MIVASFVVLNMMIAIILEKFQESQKRDENKITPEHAERFVEAWANFDPYAALASRPPKTRSQSPRKKLTKMKAGGG